MFQYPQPRVAGLIVALALLGVVAIGVARRHDIQFELGYAYENGQFHGWTPGFAQDYRKAFHWLGLAAQANHPRAQYMLGILHAQGWGVPRDGTRAVEWFTRSARNGYAPACFHLGWMVHKGDDVPRDDDRARLLEQAAGQGMAATQRALGSFYEHDKGVPADPAQALKWYAQAVHFARSRPELFDNAAARLKKWISEIRGIMKDTQPNNPLHGITLEAILNELVDFHGWEDLGRQIDIRCFNYEPSIASSLKFLRRTPWARSRVESLYVDMMRRKAGPQGG